LSWQFAADDGPGWVGLPILADAESAVYMMIAHQPDKAGVVLCQ